MKRKITIAAFIVAAIASGVAGYLKYTEYKPTYEWTYDANTNMAFVVAHDEERGLLAGTPKDPNLVPAMFAIEGKDPGFRFYPPKQPKVCNVTDPEGERVNVYYGKIDVLRSHSVEGRKKCSTESGVDSKYKVYYHIAGENASKVFDYGGPNSFIIEHQIFSGTNLESVLDQVFVKATGQQPPKEAVETVEPEIVQPEPVAEPSPAPAPEPEPEVVAADLPTEPAVVAEDDKPFVPTSTWVIIGNKHYTTAVNSKGDNPTALVRTESPLVGVVYTMVRPKDGSKCEKFDSRTEAGWGADGVNFNTVFYSVMCTDKLGPNYETVHVYTDSDADAIDEAVKGAEAAKQNVTVDNVEFPTQGFTLTRNAM